MTRLAFHLDDAFRREGGAVLAQQSFALFVSALADELGHVTLVGRLAPDGADTPHRLGPNVDLVALRPYESALSLRAVPAMLDALRTFREVLRDVDGAWLCLGPSPLSFAFAALARAHGRGVVLGVRQDTPDYVRSRHPGRRSLALAGTVLDAGHRAMSRRSAVVAVGPALAGRFRHARRVLDTSISLVRERELEQAPPDRDYAAPLLRLLSVGRLSAEKNPLALADVLAALRDRDPRWSLVVCGDGPLRRPLEERLERLGLREHADLRGYVAVGDALTEAYRTSHALLNPSWTEGVPQVLYESFAAGLPVVATAVGGVPEAAGGAAALVAPGDLEAATDAVLRVAGDEALRDALVAAGRARVSEHTLEAQARRVAGFVRDELTGTARARD